MRRALGLVLLLASLALAGCGGGDDEGGEATTDAAESVATTEAEETDTGEAPDPTAGPCALTATGEAKQALTQVEELTTPTDVVVKTSLGSFTITVDPDSAPCAGAAFVGLARAKFFDGTTFHRIVPGFVIQGGDPTATGTGGPGFSTSDPPGDWTYEQGVVAMAKSAADPPGTSGSQFFVVTGEAVQLPAEYAVIGKVTMGLSVATKIGAVATDPTTEAPLEPVTVQTMTVST